MIRSRARQPGSGALWACGLAAGLALGGLPAAAEDAAPPQDVLQGRPVEGAGPDAPLKGRPPDRSDGSAALPSSPDGAAQAGSGDVSSGDASRLLPDGSNSGSDGPTDVRSGSPDAAEARAATPATPAKPGPDRAAQEHRSRAMNKARKLGAALNSDARVPDEEDFGRAPAAQEASGVGKPRDATSPRPAVDLSRPATKKDLLIAALSGFKASFDALGMTVRRGADGRPEILNQKGHPASAEELQVLADQVRGDPEALMRRPDFFQVLPRARFSMLKQDYRGEAAARQTAFRHVAMSVGQRDFLWDASCERLSGKCNQDSGRLAYRKGEYVPPEDLDAIWGRIHGAGQGAAGSAGSGSGFVGAAVVRRIDGLGLERRVQDMLAAVGGLFGLGPAAVFDDSPESRRELGEGSAGPGKGTPPGAGRRAARPGRDVPSAARIAAKTSSLRLPGIAVVCGLALAFIILRRRREAARNGPSRGV